MKRILTLLAFVVNIAFAQIPTPHFSYPLIEPASSLVNTNPSASQLNPNKIHLVVLGDGF